VHRVAIHMVEFERHYLFRAKDRGETLHESPLDVNREDEDRPSMDERSQRIHPKS
jgi:hypothetical protein